MEWKNPKKMIGHDIFPSAVKPTTITSDEPCWKEHKISLKPDRFDYKDRELD